MNIEDEVKKLFDECYMKEGRRFCKRTLIEDGVKYYATIMLARIVWNLNNTYDKIVYNDNCVIHHKDGNKLNDSISNLIKITKKEHGVIHGTGNKNAMYGKNITEEHRKNLSLSRIGEKNHMYGKFGKDAPNYGLKRTQETKDKISEGVRGKNNYNYGIKWSDDRKKKQFLAVKRWWKNKKLQDIVSKLGREVNSICLYESEYVK